MEQNEKISEKAGASQNTPEMLWHFEGRMIRCGDFAVGELPTKGMAAVIVGEHNRAILALLSKREQREASARLIAAAPETKQERDEFLSIIRGFVAAWNDWTVERDVCEWIETSLKPQIGYARAAIHKAEGKPVHEG